MWRQVAVVWGCAAGVYFFKGLWRMSSLRCRVSQNFDGMYVSCLEPIGVYAQAGQIELGIVLMRGLSEDSRLQRRESSPKCLEIMPQCASIYVDLRRP